MEYKSEYMDNFEFHFVGHQIDNLDAALDLASARHRKIAGWSRQDDWLVFYWYINGDIVPFPNEIEASVLKEFIINWLKNNPPKCEQPDLDGSVSQGYEVLSKVHDGWSWESFRIRSIWAEHHK